MPLAPSAQQPPAGGCLKRTWKRPPSRLGRPLTILLERNRPPAAHQDTIIVLDFGSQYSRLIARRIREANVYCEILPHSTPWGKIASLHPKGFVLSGGPASVYDDEAPTLH